MTKCCSKCQIIKELTLFVTCKRNKNGYRAICKKCRQVTRKDKSGDPEYKKKWYLSNRESILKRTNEKYIKKGPRQKTHKSSKEYRLEYAKKYREINKNKIKLYQKRKRSTEDFKRYNAAKEAKRRALKLKAFVKWSNIKIIKEIYKNCPKGYHVDHIVPLKGKNVCGLHVEYNLQYLPSIENIRKSNSFEV